MTRLAIPALVLLLDAWARWRVQRWAARQEGRESECRLEVARERAQDASDRWWETLAGSHEGRVYPW